MINRQASALTLTLYVKVKSDKKTFLSAAAFTKHLLYYTKVLWNVHGGTGGFHTGYWWENLGKETTWKIWT
jgi:hypothetical protein